MGALPVEKEERLFTYADYKDWELDEGERFELIHGEAFAMSSPNTRHQAILTEISGQFYNYFQGKPCMVFSAPYDVRLFYEEDESDDTVVQPDILVVCRKEKLGEEACHGAPDLVVEILSPSNTAIEMQRKLKLYEQAGVQEYWVVDPKNKGIMVHNFKENTIITNTYGNTGTLPSTIFPDLNLFLDKVFTE